MNVSLLPPKRRCGGRSWGQAYVSCRGVVGFVERGVVVNGISDRACVFVLGQCAACNDAACTYVVSDHDMSTWSFLDAVYVCSCAYGNRTAILSATWQNRSNGIPQA